jgi:hypothetical protein
MEIANSQSSDKSFKARDAFVQATSGEHMEQLAGFRDATREKRWRIISAYLRVLDDMSGPIAVEADLPYPKERIGEAILQELADDPESDLRRRLEIAYVQLESFIPYREFRVIEDFKDASLRAQKIADMGDPTSILMSARIMRKAKGESAILLEEKIYAKMSASHLRLQRLREGYCA